MNMARY